MLQNRLSGAWAEDQSRVFHPCKVVSAPGLVDPASRIPALSKAILPRTPACAPLTPTAAEATVDLGERRNLHHQFELG